MGLKLDLKTIERLSKKGTVYTFTQLRVYCDKCGAYVDIEDFSSPLPVGLKISGIDCTIGNKAVGNGEFLIINEIDYSIPFKYKMAINLLNCHKC